MPIVRRRRPVLRAAGAAALGGAAYRAGQRSAQAPESPAPGPSYYPPAEPPSAPAGPAEPPASGVSAEPSASGVSAEPAGRGLSSETIDQLGELGRLHEQGVLTDEEFEQQKRRYLQGS